MRTITFKCDRCGVEKNHSFLWDIEIRINGSVYDQAGKKEWCRACLVKVGLWNPSFEEKKDGIKTPDHPPTLEDIIRELIREEIEG
jgi:hypothetical protein